MLRGDVDNYLFDTGILSTLNGSHQRLLFEDFKIQVLSIVIAKLQEVKDPVKLEVVQLDHVLQLLYGYVLLKLQIFEAAIECWIQVVFLEGLDSKQRRHASFDVVDQPEELCQFIFG